MRSDRARLRETGFSLVELLISLAITLIVMALVFQTMQQVTRIYEVQSRAATRIRTATLALEDISLEVARAGEGLGRSLPFLLSGPGNCLSLRTNPDLEHGHLLADLDEPDLLIAVHRSEGFTRGDVVLLTDSSGRGEVAELTELEPNAAAFRSRETGDGSFERPFKRAQGGRFQAMQEVRFCFDEGKGELVKFYGVGTEHTRVLAQNITRLSFTYLNGEGEPVASGKVAGNDALALVKISLGFDPSGEPPREHVLTTAVGLNPASDVVDFEKPGLGMRLSRLFYPLPSPAATVAPPARDWAVILGAGTRPTQDPAYLYTFVLQKGFSGFQTDSLTWLDPVRSPVTATEGPSSGPLSGSLFVAAAGLRVGQISRVEPDRDGVFSPASRVTTFERTEAIAQAGGMAFGVDGALYLTSQEKGALYRFRFDFEGRPEAPERLYSLSGTPGSLCEGTDGHLYFLQNQSGLGSIWRVRFDENLEPTEPERVGLLPGLGLSLARDPVGGSLMVLLREPGADFWILELKGAWLTTAPGNQTKEPPERLFSLRAWREAMEDGTAAVVTAGQEVPDMGTLEIEALDFLAFDPLGSLYLGASEQGAVLKFELDRPSGVYAVSIAATVLPAVVDGDGSSTKPTIRLQSWKESPGR